MSERLQAFVGLLWMLGCIAAAVYAFAEGQLGLGIGLSYASVALPIVLPAFHR